MGDFKINLKQSESVVSEEAAVAQKLQVLKGRVEVVRRGISLGSVTSTVREQLRCQMDVMENERLKLQSLRSCLDQINAAYKNTELVIANGRETVDQWNPINAQDNGRYEKEDGSGVTEGRAWYTEFFDFAAEEIGTFGVAGEGIAAFLDLAKDGINAKSGLGIGKSTVSALGKFAKEWNKNPGDRDWNSFLFGDFKKGSAVKNLSKTQVSTRWGRFTGTVKNEFGEYSLKNAKNTGSKIKTGTKWAGVIFSGIMNGIDNYEEFGNMNHIRFWEETISETAIDAGIGIAATAAATALLPATAPAVAVALVATGTVWAADFVTRQITKYFGGEEKGLTETVSDFVLDTGERVVNYVKDTFSGMGKAVSNFKNVIAKWAFI